MVRSHLAEPRPIWACPPQCLCLNTNSDVITQSWQWESASEYGCSVVSACCPMSAPRAHTEQDGLSPRYLELGVTSPHLQATRQQCLPPRLTWPGSRPHPWAAISAYTLRLLICQCPDWCDHQTLEQNSSHVWTVRVAYCHISIHSISRHISIRQLPKNKKTG